MPVTLKEIEAAELEYNILKLEVAAEIESCRRKLSSKLEEVLRAKGEYLATCKAEGAEPDLDLVVVRAGDRAMMWGASSD